MFQLERLKIAILELPGTYYLFWSFLMFSQLAHNYGLSQSAQTFPLFSHEPGFYSQPFSLEVTGVDENLYFSKDGSIPNASNRYASPIHIDNTTSFIFRLKRPNGTDTIFTRHYIFKSTDFPVLCINIDPDDLWSNSSGIYVRGLDAVYSEDRKRWVGANYNAKWEKTVFMTYFDPSGTVCISQKCGLRIFGESTRELVEKSMRLVAREKYGSNRFNYDFFKNKPVDTVKHLVIRSSGNDYKKTRFRDAMNGRLAAAFELDYQDFQPTQLFVNGIYWGVYNLREKINERFIATNHGIDKDSVEIIMGRWIREVGTGVKYMEMYRFFEGLDSMDNADFEYANSVLDVHNYARFKALQTFINNPDHRGNIRYWRKSDDTSRFKMIFYDSDHSWGYYQRNLLEKVMSPVETDWYNPTWSTMYLRKLMEHKSFKDYFLSQCAYGLSTCWSSDSLLSLVDQFERLYENELPRDKTAIAPHLYRVVLSDSAWRSEVEKLRLFARKRPERFKQQLMEYFHLEPYKLSISGVGTIKINDNLPIELPFDGFFFKGIDVELTAMDSLFVSFSQDSSRTLILDGLDGDINLVYNTKNKDVDSAISNENDGFFGALSKGSATIIFYGFFLVLLVLSVRRFK